MSESDLAISIGLNEDSLKTNFDDVALSIRRGKPPVFSKDDLDSLDKLVSSQNLKKILGLDTSRYVMRMRVEKLVEMAMEFSVAMSKIFRKYIGDEIEIRWLSNERLLACIAIIYIHEIFRIVDCADDNNNFIFIKSIFTKRLIWQANILEYYSICQISPEELRSTLPQAASDAAKLDLERRPSEWTATQRIEFLRFLFRDNELALRACDPSVAGNANLLEGLPLLVGDAVTTARPTFEEFWATEIDRIGDEASAGPLADGLAAFEGGDDATALRLWRPIAERGNAVAQYLLGNLYTSGQGVSQDFGEAVKWWRLAAEQGEPRAQHDLGTMYANGEGVPQNYAEAVKWSRKAANQGHAGGQYNLGAMYGLGQGVAQDDAEAVKWTLKAANQGHARAQYNLGSMYANGRGVAQDDAEAVKWTLKAANQGHARAQLILGHMYRVGQGVRQNDIHAHKWFDLATASLPASDARARNDAVKSRDLVASKMTPAQITQAQMLAREWTPQV